MAIVLLVSGVSVSVGVGVCRGAGVDDVVGAGFIAFVVVAAGVVVDVVAFVVESASVGVVASVVEVVTVVVVVSVVAIVVADVVLAVAAVVVVFDIGVRLVLSQLRPVIVDVLLP